MVPSLSLTPCQITKAPSASPIKPPQSSELLKRRLTVVWSFIDTLSVVPGTLRSATRCAADPGHQRGSILPLRKPERVDHLALCLRDLGDELFVVLGILVARHHVVF